jgi:hypothetical protein
LCERLGVKLPGRLGEWVAVTGVGFSPTPRLRGAIPVPLCVLCLLRVYPGEDEAASHLTKAFLRFFSVPPRLRGAIPVPACVLCLLRVYPGEDEAASHLTKAFLRFFSVPPRLRGAIPVPRSGSPPVGRGFTLCIAWNNPIAPQF